MSYNAQEYTIAESITYGELTIRINNNKLKPYDWYIINDFQTIHYIRGTNDVNTGDTESLLIQAATNNSIFNHVYSSDYPQDIIYYDYNGSTTDSNTLPNNHKGFIYHRKDRKHNIETFFDFRQVKIRLWAKDFSNHFFNIDNSSDPYCLLTDQGLNVGWDGTFNNGSAYTINPDDANDYEDRLVFDNQKDPGSNNFRNISIGRLSGGGGWTGNDFIYAIPRLYFTSLNNGEIRDLTIPLASDKSYFWTEYKIYDNDFRLPVIDNLFFVHYNFSLVAFNDQVRNNILHSDQFRFNNQSFPIFRDNIILSRLNIQDFTVYDKFIKNQLYDTDSNGNVVDAGNRYTLTFSKWQSSLAFIHKKVDENRFYSFQGNFKLGDESWQTGIIPVDYDFSNYDLSEQSINYYAGYSTVEISKSISSNNVSLTNEESRLFGTILIISTNTTEELTGITNPIEFAFKIKPDSSLTLKISNTSSITIPKYYQTDAGIILDGNYGDYVKAEKTTGNNIKIISVHKYSKKYITYSELVTHINNNNLQPNDWYVINDFQTIHNIPHTNDTHTGPTEKIKVQAQSTNSLYAQAYSLEFPQDILYYDITGNIGNSDHVATNHKGWIYRRIDTEKNIDISWDWRNVKFRRWQMSNTDSDKIGVPQGLYSLFKSKVQVGWDPDIDVDLNKDRNHGAYKFSGGTSQDVYMFYNERDLDNISNPIKNIKIPPINIWHLDSNADFVSSQDYSLANITFQSDGNNYQKGPIYGFQISSDFTGDMTFFGQIDGFFSEFALNNLVFKDKRTNDPDNFNECYIYTNYLENSLITASNRVSIKSRNSSLRFWSILSHPAMEITCESTNSYFTYQINDSNTDDLINLPASGLTTNIALGYITLKNILGLFIQSLDKSYTINSSILKESFTIDNISLIFDQDYQLNNIKVDRINSNLKNQIEIQDINGKSINNYVSEGDSYYFGEYEIIPNSGTTTGSTVVNSFSGSPNKNELYIYPVSGVTTTIEHSNIQNGFKLPLQYQPQFILDGANDDMAHVKVIEGIIYVEPISYQGIESSQQISTVTTGLTLDNSYSTILADTSNNDITLVLPPASDYIGKQYFIKKIAASNTLTIDANSTELIDFSQTATITDKGNAVKIQSDATQWWVF